MKDARECTVNIEAADLNKAKKPAGESVADNFSRRRDAKIH